MTTPSLRTVTLKTVANYRHAAERTLRAYRSGSQRLIAVVRDGVDQAAQRGAEPYVPALAAAVRRAGDNLGQLAHQGLDAVSERSSRAIAVSADSMTTQVQRVADLADGVDNKVVATGLQAAVRVSMPGARLALAVSERVASGADKLADVAAGAKANKANKANKAVKAAGKRVRTAKAEATDVAAEVKAEVRTAVRRSKAQATKAVDAATEAVAKPVKTVKAQAKKVAAKPQVKQAVAAATKPAKRTRAKAAAVVQAAQDAAATVAAA